MKYTLSYGYISDVCQFIQQFHSIASSNCLLGIARSGGCCSYAARMYFRSRSEALYNDLSVTPVQASSSRSIHHCSRRISNDPDKAKIAIASQLDNSAPACRASIRLADTVDSIIAITIQAGLLPRLITSW